MNGVLDPRGLARTYSSRTHADAWELVTEFHDVTRYGSRHPDAGPTAIADRFDLPRGRIRPWLDGSAPDPVRAIETAHDYGWFDAGFHDSTFSGLNALVANVYGGGSITADAYWPSFSVDRRDTESHVVDALELVGFEWAFVADRGYGGDEIRPTKDGGVLGRALVALGAPIGTGATRRDLTLPDYLDDAPADVRETFVVCYLAGRGERSDSKAAIAVQEKHRPSQYYDALAELIRDVADAAVTTIDDGVVVSGDAARNLGVAR